MGIGERTGNCPLEAMAVEYAQLRGTQDGMDFSVITEIAEYFEHELAYEIPPRTPFVGRSFNATRAGIHADGLLKDEEIYNIFDTAKILNRPPTVIVGSHSGAAGIAHWLKNYFGLPEGEAIDKRDPLVLFMKDCIDRQFAEGRVTSFGDSELEGMIMEYDMEVYDRLVSGGNHKIL